MSNSEPVHAPHAPLTAYYRSEQERPAWLRHMFDNTASGYDLVEKILGFGTGSWYRRQALLRAGLTSGMRVVDVGVGTGLVATQAATIVGGAGSVVGVDPSRGMLQNARVPAGIELLMGCAEEIPLPDSSCDFLSMGYALRHISDLSRAFAEFRRVLRPGGRLCILEITRPENALQSTLLKIYLRAIVPGLAWLIVRNRNTSLLWKYYWDSIEACAPPQDILRALREGGFTDGDRFLTLGMFSEYRAQKPVQ